ncbi:MAG: hypothetical protein RIC14_15955 [Filomicrobium sp.]
MRLPSTPAHTLTGLNVRVPDDFTGRRNVVLVVFEKSHLLALPPWQSVLRQHVATVPGAGFYTLILIDDLPQWRRPLTEWALRLEIADDDLLEDTAILWQSRRDWIEASATPTTEDPLLLIASSKGEVLAMAPGLPKPVATSRLIDALQS